MRSILSIVALCATLGTAIGIEASGDDETNAIDAIEQAFQADEGDDSGAGDE